LCPRFCRQNRLKKRLFRASGADEAEFAMHDPLTAARERARQWREAQDPPVAGGLVIVLDGLFVGWTAELRPRSSGRRVAWRSPATAMPT
jgi:hypothetical protein